MRPVSLRERFEEVARTKGYDHVLRLMRAELDVVDAAMGWFDAPEYGEDEAKYKLAEACAALHKLRQPAPTADGTGAEEG